jgi:hypothetical protein
MTPSFGRSLRRRGVDFLLISGQATVLYGAAAFSEDIDLWVRPAAENLRRLRLALMDLRARVHKLTAPLTVRNALRGHGFHYVIPSRAPIYLDVMGRPPRVSSYRACMARAQPLRTPMGPMAVMGIEDLVEIKKTRRLGDYDVISALVRIRLQAAGDAPSPALLRWALLNAFSEEDLGALVRRHPAIASGFRRPALRKVRDPGACRRAIALEIARLQSRDLAYWKPVLAELRRLRSQGKLLPEGARVDASVIPG